MEGMIGVKGAMVVKDVVLVAVSPVGESIVKSREVSILIESNVSGLQNQKCSKA